MEEQSNATSTGTSKTRQFAKATFSFGSVPFTLLFIITLSFIYVQQELIVGVRDPDVSDAYPLKYFQDSWQDLQIISEKPHGFNNHANDEVHDYILSRVKEAVEERSDAMIDDDYGRKTMYSIDRTYIPTDLGQHVYYLEGGNILVKIPGTDPSLKAVLVEAHYDSVVTSHGTTDAGYGVASALGVLRYILENNVSTLRTIIVNFDNNEEGGLLGAHVFMNHPWSNDTGYFLDLEGSGSGGRPIIVRTTDYGVAKHFASSPSPLGSSSSQQGFQSGLIQSDTDFSVFDAAGLRGIDLAFYKSRTWYHTDRDTIEGATIGSLSRMLDSAIAVTLSLANETDEGFEGTNDHEMSIYFDVMGSSFYAYPVSTLLKWNVIGLVAGPILVGLLLIMIINRKPWVITRHGWKRGIVSLIFSLAGSLCTALWIVKVNKNAIVSDSYSPLFIICSVFLLLNYAILGFADYIRPVYDQKLVLFIELFGLWWLSLLGLTVSTWKNKWTGFFTTTILYYLCFFGVFVGLVSALFSYHPEHINQSRNEEGSDVVNEEANEEANETTALLDREDGHEEEHSMPSSPINYRTNLKKALSYDWSLQYLVSVPLSVFFVYSVGAMGIDAFHQNLVEGDEALVFGVGLFVIVSVAIGLTLLPFIHRLNSGFAVILVIWTMIQALILYKEFPFTSEVPLRSKFTQIIDLDSQTNLVSVTMKHPYTKYIVQDLPSVKQNNISVKCNYLSNDLDECQYRGLEPHVLNSTDFNSWLRVSQVSDQDSEDRRGPNRAEIFIEAPDNRFCRVNFNTSTYPGHEVRSPVRAVTVFHRNSSNELSDSEFRWTSSSEQDTFSNTNGIESVNLYKLDWDSPGYHVGIEWVPNWYESMQASRDSLGVQVVCHYGDYDQEILVDGQLHRKVPAFDEILQYAPRWTSWATIQNGGLVQVKKYIELE